MQIIFINIHELQSDLSAIFIGKNISFELYSVSEAYNFAAPYS